MERFDTIIQSIDEATDGVAGELCPRERFIIALGKLLTVGAFYPAQHARSQKIGSIVHAALAELTPAQKAVRLEARNGGIKVQGTLLENEIPAVKQWHDILDGLAISTLIIEPDISSLNLHHLATGLLTLKLATDSSQKFVTPNFDSLPSGVTIVPREFGRRAETEDTSRKIMHMVEESLARLDDGGSATKDHPEYRELMEVFFASIVERLDKDRTGMGAQAITPQRPLDEVLKLGSHAIEHALQAMEDVHGDLDQLPQIFDNAEFALTCASDEKTVELMIEVLQQTVADITENSQKTTAWIKDPTDYKLSLNQLQDEIQTLSSSADPISNLRGNSEGEYLSLSLEILTTGLSESGFRRTTRDLANFLSGRMSKEELDILIEGTINIFKNTSLAEIDRIIPYLVSPIHRSGPEREFRFWQGLFDSNDNIVRKALWPHLAMHLFTDKKAQTQTNTWHYWVASLDSEEMVNQLPRLEAMRGFKFKKFNQKLFALAPQPLNKVFGALMSSSLAHDLGPLLHNGLANKDNPNLTRILMAACQKYEPRNQHLYQLLLTESQSTGVSRELKALASSTLNEILANLPSERQQEPWVAPALAAFGSLNPDLARPLLNKVISEKRMKMFYVWPDVCRESAQKILNLMKGVHK